MLRGTGGFAANVRAKLQFQTSPVFLGTYQASRRSKVCRAALDQPAIVLPVSLQEQIADESDAKQAAKHKHKAALAQDTSDRKREERTMRRASLAVGVLNSLSKQGSLPSQQFSTAQSAMAPTRAGEKKAVAAIAARKRGSVQQRLNDAPSALVSLLATQSSAAIPSAGGTFGLRAPFPSWPRPVRASSTDDYVIVYMACCAGTLSVDAQGIYFTSRRSVYVDESKAAIPGEAEMGSGIISSGMVLPFEPLSLAFSHIDYYVALTKVLSDSSTAMPKLLASCPSRQSSLCSLASSFSE